MGDPSGIGPEICLRMLHDESLTSICRPIVFGSAPLLERVADRLGLPFGRPVTHSLAASPTDEPAVLDIPGLDADALVPGQVSAAGGDAGYRYVTAAIDAALAQLDAVAADMVALDPSILAQLDAAQAVNPA